jgi:triphosphoribosyl-dephospho-CoA synthase
MNGTFHIEASQAAAHARPHEVMQQSARLATLAVQALIDEVTLTPKPGLVDLRGRGAHRDLDWALMCDSASALHSTFEAMAIAGATIDDPQTLRDALGRIGREGEAAMLHTTAGINTHRGAIWSLGLLLAAAARNEVTADSIAARAAAIARRTDRHAPAVTGNKGERACMTYGVGGARGQAMAGFPHVVGIALPRLRAARLRGVDENHARLDALLAVIAELDDTCILSRGGMPALRAMQSGAHAVLQADDPAQRESLLRRLEQRALTLDVSPGGAADLLAATLFLDSLASGHPHNQEGKACTWKE